MIYDILLPIVSFVGLFVGIALAYNSPEEMKGGRRYFNWLKGLIIVVTSVSICILTGTWLPALIGIVIGFFIRSSYFFLGIALALSFFASSTLSLFTAIMIFLYGLPTGSIVKATNRFNVSTMMFVAFLFFIPFSVLLLDKIPVNSTLSIIAGCLFIQAFGMKIRKASLL